MSCRSTAPRHQPTTPHPPREERQRCALPMSLTSSRVSEKTDSETSRRRSAGSRKRRPQLVSAINVSRRGLSWVLPRRRPDRRQAASGRPDSADRTRPSIAEAHRRDCRRWRGFFSAIWPPPRGGALHPEPPGSCAGTKPRRRAATRSPGSTPTVRHELRRYVVTGTYPRLDQLKWCTLCAQRGAYLRLAWCRPAVWSTWTRASLTCS